MNIVGLLTTLIRDLYTAAINYNVNPAIFIFLYVITIPVYYYGLGMVLSSAIEFRKRVRDCCDIELIDFFSQQKFLQGLVINRIGWFVPYIYVLLWGKGLPVLFVILIYFWLFISTIFLLRRVHVKSHENLHSHFQERSKIGRVWYVDEEGNKNCLWSEVLVNPLKVLNNDSMRGLLEEIGLLITSNWGDFGNSFLQKHIAPSYLIMTLRDSNGKLVAFASVSKKNLMGESINYLEFTVVDKKYMGNSLAQKMNLALVSRLFLDNIVRLKTSLEFLVITPNPRILGALSRNASFMYPDPKKMNENLEVGDADERTWSMAKELIALSDDPGRKLDRNGLVLHGSYKDTPWLKYPPKSVPNDKDKDINEFVEKYLGHSKNTGNEFIVRVKFNVASVLKGLIKWRL